MKTFTIIPYSGDAEMILLKDFCDCCGAWVLPLKAQSMFDKLAGSEEVYYVCPECGNIMG